MSGPIRKAVIPAAGYGTRLLPATKAIPKEMLPIVDKPVIQYVVEEAIDAGVEEIIFITSSNKHALEDHFDNNFELEHQLKQAGKDKQYEEIRRISSMARFVYVRQKEAKGNGHAVLVAKDLIGDEPFLVLWGDEFVEARPGRSKQLVEEFSQVGHSVITALETHDPEDTHKWGFIGYHQEDDRVRVDQVVEKPGPEKAPSQLASIGGFVLSPAIFPILEKLPPDRGEIWLTQAINVLAQQEPVYAHPLTHPQYHDAGSKFGYVKANIELGLKHPETKTKLLAYLKELSDAL